MTFKTVFVGDLNGQHKIWKANYSKACNSADEVIQLGNIIGCNEHAKDGPISGANAATLKMAFLYKATQEKWKQLIGPHEIAALNMPDEWTNKDSRKILRDSWLSQDPIMQVATVSKNRLVTHGGLTYGEWVKIGKPKTAEEAANLINEKYYKTLYQGKAWRLGDAPNFSANPIWADPFRELYPSWVTSEEKCPFGQIHGSGSLHNNEGRELLQIKDTPLYYIDKVRYRSWGSYLYIKGTQFLSIDIDLPMKIIPSIPLSKTIYIEKSI